MPTEDEIKDICMKYNKKQLAVQLLNYIEKKRKTRKCSAHHEHVVNDIFVSKRCEFINKGEYSSLPRIEKKGWRIKKTDVYTKYYNYIKNNFLESDIIGKHNFYQIIEKKIDTVKVKGIYFYICRINDKEYNNYKYWYL